MSALIGWVFRSGPRLVLVLVGLFAGLVLGGWLVSGRGAPGGSASISPTVSSSAVGLPDTRPATEVAVQFTTHWASKAAGQTKTGWLDALRPLATQQLAAGLAYTDPASLP